MATRPKGMRIAELSRRSGTSKETIHFYLREGLLRKPKKTSRNMAYYDETHVEQLKLIKRLRTESYLPLQVIKKVLKEGKLGQSARHLDLSGGLFGQGARAQFEPITKKELAERTGVPEVRIDQYEEHGLLKPTKDGRSKRYGYEDLRVTEIIRDAQREAGAESEHLVIERFQIIERHMRAVVRDEVSHFFSRVLTEGDPKRALEFLRSGRDSLGRFLAVSRARRLRQEVDKILPTLESTKTGPATEPFYYRLSEEMRLDVQEPAYRLELTEAYEAKKKDVDAARAMLRHLVLVGDGADALELYAELPRATKADEEVELLYAEALMLEERFNDAFDLLGQVKKERASTPYLEALWGTALLIRIREDFATLEPSTELIEYLSRAFGAYDIARRAEDVDSFMRARVRLLLGRVCLATPEFLGVHEQGRKDLRGCLADVAALAKNGDEALSRGPLRRLELNAVHFLRESTEDPAERRELEARAAEIGTP
jgi:DNA-binding transcriptional MerR regulator